jgi:hypothetical protein
MILFSRVVYFRKKQPGRKIGKGQEHRGKIRKRKKINIREKLK